MPEESSDTFVTIICSMNPKLSLLSMQFLAGQDGVVSVIQLKLSSLCNSFEFFRLNNKQHSKHSVSNRLCTVQNYIVHGLN